MQNMSQNIILTTGTYDLIKDHIRRKKVTPQEEELLLIAVDPAFQGRGIGRELLNRFAESAQLRGARRLHGLADHGGGLHAHLGRTKIVLLRRQVIGLGHGRHRR